MNRKVLMGACAAGMLLSLGLLIGANPSPRTATQWEYGVFLTGFDGLRWNRPGRVVWGNTTQAFIHEMGLPTEDFPQDARQGAFSFSRAFLDHLGREGWELIQVVPHDDEPGMPGSYQYAYWLKRSR
jgi:hypothetical protein